MSESDSRNTVRIQITNPHVKLLELPEAIHIYCGALSSLPDSFDVWSESTFPPRELDDGVAIRLALEGSRVTHVRAFRGLTSSFDLYILTPSTNSLLLTDHFKVAVSAVPREARRIPDEAVVDQMLFRTCPGTSSLIEGIQRLGHGELLEWGGSSHGTRIRLESRLARREPSAEDAQKALGRRLRSTMAVYGEEPATANMLSGGVDSTLLQTYLPSGYSSVSATIDLPEYEFETDYARLASELTGSRHHFVRLRHDRFRIHLEECIDNGAQPPHHLQSVLFDRLFLGKFENYLTAQFADALFGLERARWASQARLGKLLWNAPGIGENIVGLLQRLGQRAEGHASLLRQLQQDAGSPYGFAAMYAVYSDLETVVRLFGAEAVQSRLSARLDYTADRLTGTPPSDPVDAHMELGQFLDFFCDDGVSIWRQLAHGRGKYLGSPFTSRALVEAALRVPANRRYAHLGKEKEILKDLLGSRLPDYPLNQPKGASGLPFARLFPDGPLRDVFDRYSIPDFLDRDAREICRRGGDFSWNLIAYSIWLDRIAKNDNLVAPDSTLRRDWKTVSHSS